MFAIAIEALHQCVNLVLILLVEWQSKEKLEKFGSTFSACEVLPDSVSCCTLFENRFEVR